MLFSSANNNLLDISAIEDEVNGYEIENDINGCNLYFSNFSCSFT